MVTKKDKIEGREYIKNIKNSHPFISGYVYLLIREVLSRHL